MKFRFTGSTPLLSCFGFDWLPGAEHDVTDAHAIRKLGNNPMFAAADGVAAAYRENAVEAETAKHMAQRFAPAEAKVTAEATVTPIRKPRAKKTA